MSKDDPKTAKFVVQPEDQKNLDYLEKKLRLNTTSVIRLALQRLREAEERQK